MKRIPILAIVSALLFFAACGNDHGTQSNVSGNWSAVLTSAPAGQQVLSMNFTMNQNGSSLMLNNLNFQNVNNCFGAGSAMSGQMMGGTGGMMSGGMAITMDMWSNADKTGNHLSMQMNMNSGMNGATGTFTLAGVTPGCASTGGTFSMSRMR